MANKSISFDLTKTIACIVRNGFTQTYQVCIISVEIEAGQKRTSTNLGLWSF